MSPNALEINFNNESVMRSRSFQFNLPGIVLLVAIGSIIAVDTMAADVVTLGDEAALLDGVPGKGAIDEAAIDKWLAEDKNHQELDVALPKGLDAAKANLFIPDDNPITRAKVELGRQLYFDTRLSSDNTISCASCHHPDKGYGFDTQFGVGVDGQEGGRNSPVSYNRIVSKAQFWDGRADSLEAQAVGPIANPIEMGNTHEACVKSLAAIPVYKKQFEKIFDDGVNIDNVGKALATFERTLVTAPAPYDYYAPIEQFEKVFADDLEEIDDDPELKEKYDALKKAADENSMSESAVRGMKLFAKKAKCAECHAGANFTDEQYHNLGVGMDAEKPDWGRFDVTKKEKDKGAFKTPTLRNVSLSAPYMHDGSQKTLEEVVEWYNKGGHKNKWLSDKMKPLELNDQEKKDLVAFMKEGLTSSFPKVNMERLPEDGPATEQPAETDGDAKGDKKMADAKAKAEPEDPKSEDKKTDEKMAAKDTSAAPAATKSASNERGYLGVTCDADHLDVSRIVTVKPESAAAAAGFKSGDVIVKIDDKDIGAFDELKKALSSGKEGEVLKFTVKRGDETVTLEATLQGLKK